MGEWRVQISVRVSQEVRAELEKYAAREKRTLANFGAVLLEWGFEQLKTVGSTDQLLKQNISPGTKRRE
jgi:hypothetical protein